MDGLDATRTFYQGKNKKIIDSVEAVKEAKKAAEKKVRIGATGKALSEAALKVLEEYKLSNYSYKKVGLSIGHFIGLSVHDGPSLEKTVLKKGMAFTIEPGVYLPNKYGVRFEDVTILK